MMGTACVPMPKKEFKLKNDISKEYGYKSWTHARSKAPCEEKVCILLEVIRTLTKPEE